MTMTTSQRARPRLIALIAAGAFAGACTVVGPDYQRPDVSLPEQFGPEAAEAGVGAPVAPEWWQLYRDPTLNDLIASARTRNADIRIAVAQLEEAEALLREAQATLFPQIDLGATGSRGQVTRAGAVPVPPNAPVVRSDLRLIASTAFELDFWGRLQRVAEAARAQALASRHARDVVALTLSGTTAQTYFALRSVDAQRQVVMRTLRVRNESLQLVRNRAAGGIASELEVSQALAARAEAAAQLRDLERQRRVLENLLGVLTGQLGLRVAEGDLLALPVPPTPPLGLPSSLLERRPDIRAAEQQLVAANARIGVARAAMYPTISLTGFFGGQSADLADLLNSGARIWSLGFGLALPIFDAGRIAARTEQAEARQRQVLGSYQRAIETGFREVADGIANLSQSTAVEADLQARVDAARNALRLSTIRYESGYSAYLEVLDAQRTVNDAELAWVRNRQARLAYSVDLMRALGGGWAP